MGTPSASVADALLELDALTRTLRRECPWDRAQDERSIVPHTVEESYELVEAAHSGDDGKLLDELGDVMFQVFFLALLLEERGAGDLGAVARGTRDKLIHRHPHVFGEGPQPLEKLPTQAKTPEQVRENWDAIKREEANDQEPFAGIPSTLPALLYARKLQRRAPGADERGDPVEACEQVGARLEQLAEAVAGERRAPGDDRPHHGTPLLYERIGDLLFATVALSRATQVDPELALRLAAERFREHANNKEAG